jgi:hypothetical protein
MHLAEGFPMSVSTAHDYLMSYQFTLREILIYLTIGEPRFVETTLYAAGTFGASSIPLASFGG